MPHLLVIGGSDAGISAALRARELDASWDVTVVVADAYPNFSICGLPFYLSGETPDWRHLAHRTRQEIEAEGIELLLDHTAESIDSRRKDVIVASRSRGSRRLSYDKLLIGTGAVPRRPQIPGLDLPGVHLLRTMEDSFAVHECLESRGPRSAVVVGGGYIGTEMAGALTHRGLHVTLVERSKGVMKTVDPELARLVGEELGRHGIGVAGGVRIERIRREDAALAVCGAAGFEARADLVLLAVGVEPDAGLARAAGAETGERGAIRVNRRMETGLPGVYAAGDCAETWHRLLGANTYLPLGTTAHKQGRVAGENAVGGEREFAGSLGTQVVKVFDLAVARTGLRDGEARGAGFEPHTEELAVWDHKAYYPGARKLHIRVTGDRATGRLLGAQIVGHWRSEVGKRIDLFATALYHGMSVDEIGDLDLSYTPPLSSPWDPVQSAAQAWVGGAKGARGAQPHGVPSLR
jgi:NADPH-dependent 2,4-dienoyl-CoA reductase/sulfur reductase-like enzyme